MVLRFPHEPTAQMLLGEIAVIAFRPAPVSTDSAGTWTGSDRPVRDLSPGRYGPGRQRHRRTQCEHCSQDP